MNRTARLLLLALLWLSPMASPTAWPATRGAQEQPPLTVEDLACRGNVHTSCTFILGQVYLAPGDRVDEDEIENAKLRLSVLRNFAAVSIYLEKGSERGRARVIVEVVEASMVTTNFAAGSATTDGGTTLEAFGRLTYNNLFGAGKILDLRAQAYVPVDGVPLRQKFARVAYVDPHLFDSKRYFASAGMGYIDAHSEHDNGDMFDRRQLAVDVTAGRRLWDFSYFSLGYQYRPIRDFTARYHERGTGRLLTADPLRSGVLIWTFGGNTEDDDYFPTRGSRYQAVVVASGGHSEDLTGFYRRTWSWGSSVLSAQIQQKNGVNLGLARPLDPNGVLGGVRRARWYTNLSTSDNGYDAEGRRLHFAAASAGVLLETHSFGIVRFYVVAGTNLNR